MRSFNLSAWAVTHRPMVLFLLIITLLAGVFSFSRLGRLEDPIFNVPVMTVVVAWPGASAREVQDEVLNRIERQLQGIDGVDYIRSYARQGFGGITLNMKGGTSSQDLDRAWYQARKKVGDIRDSLPAGVRGPFFNDEFTDVYSVLYAVSAPDLSPAELHEQAADIQRALQRVDGVNKVDILGSQDEKVYVDFSSRRLAGLGLSPQQLMDTLDGHLRLAPAGLAENRSDRIYLRPDAPLHSATEVAALPVQAGARQLRLGDVARVHSGYADPPSFTIRHNGQPVLAIGVTMSRNGNILQLGKALDAQLQQIRAGLPAGVSIEQYADQPKVVEESVWEFERSFLEALAIVLAVSFFFLGWRTGIVVAASVPLVLSLVAVVMAACGWPLDRISLGALIIALGLLVDDAIIAVEMMVVKMEQGWNRFKAATFAYTSTAFPMLTGTLVTVAGFMPVGFARSIAGEYAGGIFWIVGLALITSWLVAVIFTPYLGVMLLPNAKPHAGGHHDAYDTPLYRRARRIVDWAVTHRRTVMIGTGLLFVTALAGMGLVQQQFFPTASRTELLVEFRLREGASFAATQRDVMQLEQILRQDKDVEHYTAYTGAGSPRFFLSLSPELPDPGYAQFVIQTRDIQAREALRRRLQQRLNQDPAFADARSRVLRLEFGPPVGFPVQFRVIGPDTAQVRAIAYQVRDIVRQSPLVYDTQLEWNELVRTQRLKIDRQRASQLGLSQADIANLLQVSLEGAPVSQIRRGEDLIDVVLRGDAHDRRALEHLQDIRLTTRSGQVIPLSQVAQVVPAFEEPVLWRRNREMALTVRSEAADGVQAPYASEKIWPQLQPLISKLPPGYRIEAGGAIEESNKANKALFAIFPLMFLAMLLILMVQLQSFARMMMVFLTAPLGLIGVVPALLIFNAPFGFVALLGVIALGGMIMRNSVILVDQIDQDIEHGTPAWQAIVGATIRRSRPVILTAAAAILAMIPLAGSVFWGPMAMAIMGGLIAATALTLVFVPALYASWFRIQRP
ncbi:efflux RND transporter permease subunit [Paludibacterium sp. B53371]|uniref:efflux RND transporter permease subunit n=1 Tax=Paludibacterium sp. B53371 TaxID=2806263 RepID=UPI001C0591E3|nr:efflux RND transporter permease subunit [Paludibacterium sp. B53371]